MTCGTSLSRIAWSPPPGTAADDRGIGPAGLQNQIDSGIEAHVARVELQLLKELQKAMKQKTCAWTEIFSTVFLILRVTEKDIWRLMYWLKHDKEVSTGFQPPSFPLTLLTGVIRASAGVQVAAPRRPSPARAKESVLLQSASGPPTLRRQHPR